MKKHSKCNNWMMLLCFAPVFVLILVKVFFPTFAYLSILALLICPISMGLMMVMDRGNNHCKINGRRKLNGSRKNF